MTHYFINGNIGSGKTTLIKNIAKELDCKVYFEEFHDVIFLSEFYKNKTLLNSMMVQMEFMTKYIQ